MNDEVIMRDFEAFRKLVGLDELRLERLRVVGEWLRPKVTEITDVFYERLLADPTTAAFLDGKIEHLKMVHHAWIEDILSGIYDESFFVRQIKSAKRTLQIRFHRSFSPLGSAFCAFCFLTR